MAADKLRSLVSRHKRRFQEDGFDLDLTYVKPNIIAMGFPSHKIEGVYRNHISDVIRFLESKHKDHYKVYNLCSERHYDVAKFRNRVASFPFDDHHPPPFVLIKRFCEDMAEWLDKDEKNIAAVHCKAGKGRTGVMICAYLLHCKHFQSADEVLDFYAQTRTRDRKGVTIPSQRRYVRYYDALLRSPTPYAARPVLLREIHLRPVPRINSGACMPLFAVFKMPNQKLVTTSVYEGAKKGDSCICMKLDVQLPISEDIRVEIYHKSHKIAKREKLLHLWFNTFFIPPRERVANGDASHSQSWRASQPPEACTTPSDPSCDLCLELSKNELDKANKDKKTFTADFKVALYFQSMAAPGAPTPPPSYSQHVQNNTAAPPPPYASSATHLTPTAVIPPRQTSPVMPRADLTEDDDYSDKSSIDEWDEVTQV